MLLSAKGLVELFGTLVLVAGVATVLGFFDTAAGVAGLFEGTADVLGLLEGTVESGLGRDPAVDFTLCTTGL
jgi:hypothetical protein